MGRKDKINVSTNGAPFIDIGIPDKDREKIALGLSRVLAPPNGTSTRAHFQVIHIASARTSSRSVVGWNRIPPFAGPRAMLCCTR